MTSSRVAYLLFLIPLLAACGSMNTAVQPSPSGMAPVGASATGGGADSAGNYPDPEQGPVAPAEPVTLAELPTIFDDPATSDYEPARKAPRPRTMISPEEADRRRAESMLLPPQPAVQSLAAENAPPGPAAPLMEHSFEALNFDDGYGQTPPDQELAAGPNHVVAVVNSMLEVYDHTGATVVGPVATNTFFSGVPGCSSTFDPNVLYDEKEDRFFVGIDSFDGPDTDNGYCFAVSATGDPTGAWYRYSFDATYYMGDFLDYPHAGVGNEALVVGGNVYGDSFHADVWAIKKSDVYSNQPASIVRQTMSGDTPQPMNSHGFAQGTWPNGNTHYILNDGSFDGTTIQVTAWTDPFGANTFTSLGTVDLNSFTGVVGGYPIDTPQAGSGNNIQGNDYRVQDAEYRNGRLWMSHTIACNPGSGTVNCIRWAEIDPVGGGSPAIVQAGVFGSDGEYRIFADLAVNHCNDVTIGYTKSSTGFYPSVVYTGRLGSDLPGTVQAEALLKAGELPHSSYDTPPYRWGDYSGATSDPDGVRTWYLGQYTRPNVGGSTWGTFVGHFSTACQAPGGDLIFADGFDFGNTSGWTTAVP